MTIEEAIQHCKETATENRRCVLEFARVNVYDAARNCQECAAEHEQLAEWLTELKQRREADITAQPKTNADRIRQMTDEELADVMQGQCACCAYQLTGCAEKECKDGAYKWLKQKVEKDDER